MSKPVIATSTVIESKIYCIRGQKVMLDRDLADLYGVETKVLNQSVKRNILRFPADFMFQLTKDEFAKWRSQIVTSNNEKMGLRWKPYAFTENGVAMLSSVLNSQKAIKVNIEIMRIFTQLRDMARSNKVLWEKIRSLESKYDAQFKVVFDALRALIKEESKPKRKIGFHR